MELQWAQVFTQIIAFLVFLWILKRWAWGPLQKILDERQQKIAQEFADIEKQKQEVATMAADYSDRLKKIDKEAHARVTEGIREGERVARKIREEAEKRAEERLKRALAEIEAEKAKAKDEIRQEMVELSFNMVDKVLKQKSTPEQQQKWIDEFIQEADIR